MEWCEHERLGLAMPGHVVAADEVQCGVDHWKETGRRRAPDAAEPWLLAQKGPVAVDRIGGLVRLAAVAELRVEQHRVPPLQEDFFEVGIEWQLTVRVLDLTKGIELLLGEQVHDQPPAWRCGPA